MKNYSVTSLIFAALIISFFCGCIKTTLGTKQPVWHENAEKWQIPVRVAWTKDLEGASIEAAIENVNSRVGCDVLKKAEDFEIVDVYVEAGEFMPCGRMTGWDVHKDDAANVYLCGEGTAEINVMEPGSLIEFRRIMEHELGHVLGLAHDPLWLFRNTHTISSMVSGSQVLYVRGKGQQFGQTLKDNRPRRISDVDAAALNKLYCK